ncbi:hypothetical protein IFU30_12440 [Plantibacter sp. CFBP 8798]|uniref:JmjC domain-containing protein n=1 Tax=Plantibacter sp. CFBP 8798 TaxID=2775268 RepID=UPI00177C1726|nr:cupin domain-containing protein [Plantibacter sp. CFBP 8798]MBD8467078.1 hypothetical protein [Plantibacter sp. CFBP 8798]
MRVKNIAEQLSAWFIDSSSSTASWSASDRAVAQDEVDRLREAVWLSLRGGTMLASDLISLERGVGSPCPTDELGVFAAKDAVEQIIAGGKTARILGIEHQGGSVSALFEEAWPLHAQRLTGNIYITPPKQAGSVAHTDPMDVLILQLEGEKLWTIAGTPVLSLPGSVVRMRAGVQHEARGGASQSMHLTFSVTSST